MIVELVAGKRETSFCRTQRLIIDWIFKMKIRVTYSSGEVQDFVVHEDISVMEFHTVAARQNILITKIKFI